MSWCSPPPKLRASGSKFSSFSESIPPSPVAIFLLLKNEKQLMSPNVPHSLLLILAPGEWAQSSIKYIPCALQKFEMLSTSSDPWPAKCVIITAFVRSVTDEIFSLNSNDLNL